MAPLPVPRVLPAPLLRPVKFSFDFEPIGALSRTLGGAVSFQEKIGGSLWRMDLQSRPLSERDYGEVFGWKSSLHGSSISFKAFDLRRCFPLNYGKSTLALPLPGGGTFNGTAQVTAAGGGTINVSGLPASYTVTVGDYFSFPWLGTQRLVRALETAGANASGVMTGLNIAPWLRSGGTVPATVVMVQAWVLMRMLPGSWSGERTVRDPVAFSAVETPA